MPRHLNKLGDALLEDYKNEIPIPDDFPQKKSLGGELTKKSRSNSVLLKSCTLEIALSYTFDFYPNISVV